MADVRLSRPKRFEDLFKRLATGDDKVFPYQYDVLTFAAVLGYRKGRRAPVGESMDRLTENIWRGKSVEEIAWIIHALKDGETSSLSDQLWPERMKIFEEYAAGGLEILQEEFDRAGAAHPIDVLCQLIGHLQAEDRPDPDDVLTHIFE